MYHITGEYAKNNFSEVLEKASTEPGGVVMFRKIKVSFSSVRKN
jgi:hypothetical protein